MSEAPEENPSDDWYLKRSTRAERLRRLGTRPEAGRERVYNTGPWPTSAQLAGCLSGVFVGCVLTEKLPEKPPK
jgi:hypothetical protein